MDPLIADPQSDEEQEPPQTCTACGGHGHTINARCTHCGGDGLEPASATVAWGDFTRKATPMIQTYLITVDEATGDVSARRVPQNTGLYALGGNVMGAAAHENQGLSNEQLYEAARDALAAVMPDGPGGPDPDHREAAA